MTLRRGPAAALLLGLLTAGGAFGRALPLRPPGVAAADPRQRVDPTAMPWRAVGRLQSGEISCTGFLTGPATVVAAAHCFYSPRLGHFLPSRAVHFVLDYAQGEFAGHSLVRSYLIGDGYAPTLGASLPGPPVSRGADWAVVTLATPLGKPGQVIRLARGPVPPGTAVVLGGYGQDRREVIFADLHCAVTGSGMDQAGRLLLIHDCSATLGTSGGPLLRKGAEGWEAVGIQVAAPRFGSGGLAVPADTIRLGKAKPPPMPEAAEPG